MSDITTAENFELSSIYSMLAYEIYGFGTSFSPTCSSVVPLLDQGK